MAKDGTFPTFHDALSWGRTNGRDYVHFFQRWYVVKRGKRYALAICNVNSGAMEGFIHA